MLHSKPSATRVVARVAFAGLLALAVAGCQPGSLFGPNVERPKGPGSNTDDLRPSPCACVELPNAPPDLHLLFELKRLEG